MPARRRANQKQENEDVFTIMQRINGSDLFFSAENVHYVGPFSESEGPSDTIVLLQEDGVKSHLIGGEVFVMNERGATVGRYVLPNYAAPGTPAGPTKSAG
jgi:hypothetical protein